MLHKGDSYSVPRQSAGTVKDEPGYFPGGSGQCMEGAEVFKKFLKFGITGGLGTVTNLVLFFILVDGLHLAPSPISAFCFLIAGTQNYLINHLWTFKVENRGTKPSFTLWAKFMISSLCGLAINLIVLNLLLHFFSWPYTTIPQALGILAGMGVNFLFSNFLVFRP